MPERPARDPRGRPPAGWWAWDHAAMAEAILDTLDHRETRKHGSPAADSSVSSAWSIATSDCSRHGPAGAHATASDRASSRAGRPHERRRGGCVAAGMQRLRHQWNQALKRLEVLRALTTRTGTSTASTTARRGRATSLGADPRSDGHPRCRTGPGAAAAAGEQIFYPASQRATQPLVHGQA